MQKHQSARYSSAHSSDDDPDLELTPVPDAVGGNAFVADDDDDFMPISRPQHSNSLPKPTRPQQSRDLLATVAYGQRLTPETLNNLTTTTSLSQALTILVASQAHIKRDNWQPRNKAKDKGVGLVYNAYRTTLLREGQLNSLYSKAMSGAVQHADGCLTAGTPAKRQPTAASSPEESKAPSRPRGVQLDKQRRVGFFAEDSTTFELTHLILVKAGRYPPTSEHEVSHLCHNPHCIALTHLVWELHPDNVDREACRYTRSLHCPKCGHRFGACEHNPPCVACTCANQ